MISVSGKADAVVRVVLLVALAPIHTGLAAELAGATAWIDDYHGPATIHAELTGRHKLEINFDPGTESRGVVIRVELPVVGRNAWPAADVAVFNSKGQSIAVRRAGIEWHKLRIAVPPERSTFVIRTVDVAGDKPRIRPEEERTATDPTTGVRATICRWYDGRRAALSIRFDDSHPTHLSTAIPILNEYGFRGTFMVNPGAPNAGSLHSRRRSSFQEHLSGWEAVAQRGNHEFANHTLEHKGAGNDEETEYQIGEASSAIWKLFPSKSRLFALNLGGGTWWTTTRTLRFYLDKYHLFDASSGSTGMDDVYGNRVAEFRRLLERHLERGGWYRVHYHSIGNGQSSSEANFRSALDIAQEHEADLWIAGMADIYKYQTERRGAALAIEDSGPGGIGLRLSCATPLQLYDQPLTIELMLPNSWPPNRVTVQNEHGQDMAIRSQRTTGKTVVRFDVAPRDARYSIRVTH